MHFCFLRLHTIVAYLTEQLNVRRDTRVKDTHLVHAYIEKKNKISVVEHKNMFCVNQR